MCNWKAIQKQYGLLISIAFVATILLLSIVPSGYLISAPATKSYPGYGYGTYGGAQTQTAQVTFSPDQTKYTLNMTPYSERPLDIKIGCNVVGSSIQAEVSSGVTGFVFSQYGNAVPSGSQLNLKWDGKNQFGNKQYIPAGNLVGLGNYKITANCRKQDNSGIIRIIASKSADILAVDNSPYVSKSSSGNSEELAANFDKSAKFSNRAVVMVRRQTGVGCKTWAKYKIFAIDRNGQSKELGTTEGITAGNWGAVSGSVKNVDVAQLKAKYAQDSGDLGFDCHNAIGMAGIVFYEIPPPVTDYQFVVSNSEISKGIVKSTDAQINCGYACTKRYTAGTTVTLVATPTAGYKFDGWSGACTGTSTTCTIPVSSDKSVTAKFTSISGGGGGGGCTGGKCPLMQ